MNQIKYMQKNMYGLLLAGVILASCGSAKKDNSGDLNDKKAKLEELKKEKLKVDTEIAQLQNEISRQDTSASSQTAKLVAIAPVVNEKFTHFVDLQGRIDAVNISYVSPPNGMGGVVTALYVRQGDFVRKGQSLAKLDDQLIRQQMEPLRVQLITAEDTYRRTKNLYDQGIGTYQQVLNARTQVESLQKQLQIIQKQASLMNVTAPSAGVIDQLNLRVGEMLSPQQNPAAPQIRIVNTSSLKIVAEVPENYLGRIGQGSTLFITLPNIGRKIETKVNVAGKIIDPNKRTFYIEAPIPQHPDFKPNQVANVQVQDYVAPSAVTIPVNTLQNDDKGKFVMVAVNENGKLIARKRQVSVGELYEDRLEVKAGLQPNDQLIVEGFQSLYDGQLITTKS